MSRLDTSETINYSVQQSPQKNNYDTENRYGCDLTPSGSQCNPCLTDPSGIGRGRLGVWERTSFNCNSYTGCHYHCSGLDLATCVIGSGELGSEHPPDASILNPVRGFPKGTLDGRLGCSIPVELASQDTPFVVNYTNGIEGGLAPADKTSQDFGRLYRNFCGRVADHQGKNDVGDTLTCPNIPIAAIQQPQKCSYFTASGSNADRSPSRLCDAWQDANVSSYDDAVVQYCDQNQTDDCLCLHPEYNETTGKLFQAIENSINPELRNSRGCWFLPCTIESGTLVTSDFKKQQANCEQANICENVIKVTRSSGINLNDVSQFLNCDVPQNGDGGDGGDGGFLPSTIFGIRTEFFLIGVVVLVVIIIIIGVLISRSGDSNSS